MPKMQTLAEKEQESQEIIYMNCPYCSAHIAASWQPLSSTTDELGRPRPNYPQPNLVTFTPQDGRPQQLETVVTAQWLLCQNPECREVVVQITRTVRLTIGNQQPEIETWIACPKRKAPPVPDPLITDPLRKDYIEAWNILDDSCRMSAALSRRMLSDLLKKYDGATQFQLEKQIDAFISKPQHPTRLKENLQYLREIGNFATHTQVQQNPPVPDPPILDATKEEAEWTLKNVADLFDYFIVAPAKDKQLRTSLDAKIAAAGRKPIT